MSTKKRVNRKWGKTLNPHPQWHTSSRLLWLWKILQCPQMKPPTGDWVFEHLVYVGTFFIQTTYPVQQKAEQSRTQTLAVAIWRRHRNYPLCGLCSRGEIALFQRLQHSMQDGEGVDVSSGQVFLMKFSDSWKTRASSQILRHQVCMRKLEFFSLQDFQKAWVFD